MKQLEQEFNGKGQVKGFRFTLIKKSDYGYIYKIDTGDAIHYEVFGHKENTRFDCVSYPSNKAFGLWAWTTSNLDRAFDLLEEIDIRKEVLNNE